MEAWWFRIAYFALFLIFVLVFRFLFNRWRRQALEDQANFHNSHLANQRDSTTGSSHESGSRDLIGAVDELPPEFEEAVKYSKPVSYIDISESSPPTYDEIVKQIASTNQNHDILFPVLESSEFETQSDKHVTVTVIPGELVNHM